MVGLEERCYFVSQPDTNVFIHFNGAEVLCIPVTLSAAENTAPQDSSGGAG